MKTFECPGCAASLEYDPAVGKLKCGYCGSELEVEKEDAAATVVEMDFEEARGRASEGAMSARAVQVECGTCGAAVVFEAPQVAGSCAFCAARIVAQPRAADPLIAPQGVLPFGVTKGAAGESVKGWLSSRWFAPSDLKRVARPEGIEGVYLPFWTYDARATTEYTGARGEHYWESESYTEMVNGRAERRTRRVRKTRWHAAAGRVEDAFDDVLVAATRAVAAKRLDELSPWGLEKVEAYDPAYLAGFKAQVYQVGLEEGFGVARERMEEGIRGTIRRDIGGDEQRILTMNVALRETTFKHLLLPVWIGAFRYGGKTFQVTVNARTGEVSGERPYSAWKIAGLVLVIVLAVLVMVWLKG